MIMLDNNANGILLSGNLKRPTGVQILGGMKMRPSSLTLFILAPERIALTSRLKGEGEEEGEEETPSAPDATKVCGGYL